MSFNAGAIVGKMTLNDKGFQAAISSAKGTAGKLPGFMGPIFTGVAASIGVATAAGAALGGVLLLLMQKTAKYGDTLDKMSARTGLSVEFLDALGYAAERGGSSLGAMEMSVKRLQRAASDAAQGLATQKRAFDELGISVTDADGRLRSTEELFMEVGTAVAGLENETRRGAVAQEIFGKSGADMIPVLKGGRDGLSALFAEHERLGGMTTSQAAAAAAYTDAQTKVSRAINGIVYAIGGQLLPIVTPWLEKLSAWIAMNREWLALKFADGVAWTVETVKWLWAESVKLYKVFDELFVKSGYLAMVWEYYKTLGADVAFAFNGVLAGVLAIASGYALAAYAAAKFFNVLSFGKVVSDETVEKLERMSAAIAKARNESLAATVSSAVAVVDQNFALAGAAAGVAAQAPGAVGRAREVYRQENSIDVRVELDSGEGAREAIERAGPQIASAIEAKRQAFTAEARRRIDGQAREVALALGAT